MLEHTLQKYFGFDNFRPGQKDSIEALLEGKDVFTLLPTGAGKSLIYQFVSIMKEKGITVVISPLIALMKDQTDSLRAKGISAETCNSSQDELTQMKTLSLAVQGKIRLLFVSPERALSESFLRIFYKMDVNFLVVDEAHCVSQWGHDFRPEYRMLAKLRESHPKSNFPIAALTATATPKVGEDIVRSLGMKAALRIQQSFFRPNLRFRIEYPERASDKEEILLKYLEPWRSRNPKGRVIIYCATRAQVDDLYNNLNLRKFSVGKYHAGRTEGIRERTHNAYASGKVKILIATNAFGMGIDHPDVRMVLHYQVPASLESYYQEAGRAGRDGDRSECILFYHNADLAIQSFILSKEANRKKGDSLLGTIREFGKSEDCRQVFLCKYFGEDVKPCGICDNCEKNHLGRNAYLEREEKKETVRLKKRSHVFSEEEEKIVLDTVRTLDGKYGKTSVAAMLKGSRSKDVLRKKLERYPQYGTLSHIPESSIVRLLEDGLEKKLFAQKGDKYPKIYLASSPPTKRIKSQPSESVNRSVTTNTLILRQLKSFRDAQARKLRWKKFMVLQNPVLKRIAEDMPKDLDELASIKGMGDAKIDKFGEQILQILSKFQKE
ncbi:RecQ family ATP-dependent DNA helicase [Leptospira sp. GIMC2001]|uniref:RecQ family ATP-dependent DNA helicase n=1 Tax=Leptospira sp. GIMC2001 TaxID=1513297 RepID=UPI00234BD9F8|nr:RecQ family ATP-dependent DNA helicase [Leptospira sp. GIMC2001]WCL48817.1 RecQ family ATP-dependent DNA helicase [Leptospira sp. GIMC2001]